jgi:hypothetical protein
MVIRPDRGPGACPVVEHDLTELAGIADSIASRGFAPWTRWKEDKEEKWIQDVRR